jgi:hypothetical protein
MSGLRSKAAAALVSLLLWPAAIAAAQTTLTPSAADEGQGVGPPVVLTPPGAEGPGSDGTALQPVPAPSVERTPEGIEVDTLAAVASDYGGTLDPGSGGFPIDMWRGSDRAFVERVLPQLPVARHSPALRDLARRLLLSSATAPAGPAQVSLFSVRAGRLSALGDREGAAALMAMVPEAQRDAASEQLRLEAAFLAGEDEQACADVATLIHRFDQDPYLQKALIYCQAKAGQTDQATLGLDLLREQGHADDETFFDLVKVLTGLRKDVKIESLGEPKGLHYALLKATGQTLPEGAMAASEPDMLESRLASDDPTVRLVASEEAVAAGLAQPEALARAYRAEAVTPEELAGALDLVPDSPHARAVLFQAATQATIPTTRAALIQKALAAARKDGSFLTAGRVYLPAITELTPAPPIAAVAGEVGRALYLGGQYELAGAWLDTARTEAARNPDAAAAVPVLWLLARIAGSGEALVWDAKSVAAWRQAQAAAGDAEADLRAARLFALFDGLGEPAGDAWRVLADPAAPSAQPMINPATWFALGDAGEAGRLGETVMLALCALGADGPGGAHPLALSRAIAALRQVGLDAEARTIAFEAALANGV